MAAAQPIALPPSSNDYDLVMGSGSYAGQNGSFNIASYSRRFPGSPASFRAGSFGSRFYPGVSPGQLLGPLDPNDFRFGKVSSSIESDRGSIMNALNVFERQDELCRDYQCCGVNLTDMHALVDHFEECHVVVVDPLAPHAGFRGAPSGVAVPQGSYFPDSQNGSTVQMYHQGSFNPDDMELDADNTSPSSSASSPPDTPVSTPLSAHPGAHPHPHIQSQGASSARHPPVSAFETTTIMPSRSGHAMSGFQAVRSSGPIVPPRAEDAFNAYAGYSDYSSLMPGTVPAASAPSASSDDQAFGGNSFGARSGCVPPALLLNSSTCDTPSSTPSSSRVASPAPGSTNFPGSSRASPTSSSSAAGSSGQASAARASTTLSRPASSLLLSKPFKCPKPNCNKSYKQANGLKYHMTHGSCNFAPPKDLEHLQALLASKRSQKAEEGGEPISDAELREVEKEAERRLRPYACGVGDCQRRYKNMNGLRYHYQHSGDHGAIGLALLASGQHECLQHTRAHHSRTATPSASAAASANNSPHGTPVVSQAQAAQRSGHSPPSSHPTTPTSPHHAYPQNIAPAPSYNATSAMPQAYAMHQQQYTMQHQPQMGYVMSPMSQ
ncbi:hypothetical protein BXZ70DRAFT_887340 [Cristinia sonorae]|uniref:C2H2-type domain-containing protein n=1 Tax=Cristinia sonorae TaxID=1940300 RepID=A0A8K0UXB6_9AGAR|nr:hypothetical protein BXZ70DRAFT_887340 [Cristinia sonorae]